MGRLGGEGKGGIVWDGNMIYVNLQEKKNNFCLVKLMLSKTFIKPSS